MHEGGSVSIAEEKGKNVSFKGIEKVVLKRNLPQRSIYFVYGDEVIFRVDNVKAAIPMVLKTSGHPEMLEVTVLSGKHVGSKATLTGALLEPFTSA